MIRFAHHIKDLALETVKEFSRDQCFRLGAALSYYTVFSLAPMLIIVMAVAGFFLGDEAMRGEIYRELEGIIGTAGAAQIQDMVKAATARESSTLATALSAASLLFGATGVFYMIKDSLNVIWKVKAVPKSGIWKFIKDRILSFALIIALGFILLVAQVLNAIILALGEYLERILPDVTAMLLQLGNIAISLLVSTVLFAIIFKVLPDVRNRWSDVWVGAFFTAVMFAVGKALIGVYIGASDVGSTYGAAGSIVVILLWVYYASQILFVGAEFTYVYARRYGSQILPSSHAVRVVRQEVEADDPKLADVTNDVERAGPKAGS
jgi:membrane protein